MKFVPYDPAMFQEFACESLEEAQIQARKLIQGGVMDNVLIVRVDCVEGIMEKVSPVWNPAQPSNKDNQK